MSGTDASRIRHDSWKDHDESGEVFPMRLETVLTVAPFVKPVQYGVPSSTPATALVESMRTHRIRHLPIIDRGELVGVVSERDLRCIAQVDDPRTIVARDVMSSSPFVVAATTPLREVVRAMAERRIGSALVRRGGRLVGMFT